MFSALSFENCSLRQVGTRQETCVNSKCLLSRSLTSMYMLAVFAISRQDAWSINKCFNLAVILYLVITGVRNRLDHESREIRKTTRISMRVCLFGAVTLLYSESILGVWNCVKDWRSLPSLTCVNLGLIPSTSHLNNELQPYVRSHLGIWAR